MAQGPLSGRGMMGSILEPMLMVREVVPGGRERGARDLDSRECWCVVVEVQSLAMLSRAVLWIRVTPVIVMMRAR